MTAADDFLSAARDLDLLVSADLVALFKIYVRELVSWNRHLNLTRIQRERDVFINHFLDSLIAARFIPEHAAVLDIGSGAGFPGIPLKMFRPDLNVTLADSVFKKVAFQRHLIRTLGLENIRSVHQRIGEGEESPGVFTVCISRAFGSLPALFAAAAPVLAADGRIIALKGPRVTVELAQAAEEVQRRGLVLQNQFSVVLPYTGMHRTVVVFARIV